MESSKKRKFDVDDETPVRMMTTLDILDEHPFLSKQLQASCALRNLDVSSHVNRTLSVGGNVFTLLTQIFEESVKRYFPDDLEMIIIQREKGTLCFFANIGSRENILWTERYVDQPFSKKLDKAKSLEKHFTCDEIDRFYKAGKMLSISEYKDLYFEIAHERDEWLTKNPEPDFPSNDDSKDTTIYFQELKKFVERYKVIINNLGIEFVVGDRNDQFDHFNFFITDKESNIGKFPEYSFGTTKNYDIEEELAKAKPLPQIRYPSYMYKIDSFPNFSLNQLPRNIIPCPTLINNGIFPQFNEDDPSIEMHE